MLPRADASGFEGCRMRDCRLNACIVESEAGGPARPSCRVFTVQYSIPSSQDKSRYSTAQLIPMSNSIGLPNK